MPFMMLVCLPPGVRCPGTLQLSASGTQNFWKETLNSEPGYSKEDPKSFG